MANKDVVDKIFEGDEEVEIPKAIAPETLWHMVDQESEDLQTWPKMETGAEKFKLSPEKISPRIDSYDFQERSKEEYAAELEQLKEKVAPNPTLENGEQGLDFKQEHYTSRLEGSKGKNWYSVIPNLFSGDSERKEQAKTSSTYLGLTGLVWGAAYALPEFTSLEETIGYAIAGTVTLLSGTISEMLRKSDKQISSINLNYVNGQKNIRQNLDTVIKEPQERINPHYIEEASDIYGKLEEAEMNLKPNNKYSPEIGLRKEANNDLKKAYQKAEEIHGLPSFSGGR